MDLIEIRSARKGDLPISRNTAYKWHSLKKYPALLYKVSGILYFDKAEWERMAEVSKKKAIQAAKRLYDGDA